MKKKYIFTLLLTLCIGAFSFGQTTFKGKSIEGFSAYPNPVKNGKLTIATSNSEEKEVIIYSVLGKQVFRQKFTSNRKQLDVSRISAGIYIMKVLEGNNIATKKVVIK